MAGLHGHIIGQLARRGAAFVAPPGEAIEGAYFKSPDGSALPHLSGMMMGTLAIVFVTFIFSYASVRYTLGEVIASLAMVEQPKILLLSEAQSVPTDENEKTEDTSALLSKGAVVDEEITFYKVEPITASIRQTLRHLKSIGGYAAEWRGFSISIVYGLLQGILANAVRYAFLSIVPGLEFGAIFAGSVIATVLLARIHMTWTHIMISEPSSLPWYRRVPRGRVYFRALVVPSCVYAAAQCLTIFVPMMVHSAVWPVHADAHQGKLEVLRPLATLATLAFFGFALLLPASVTLTRIEASLLPQESETIVNFDRTLGGAATDPTTTGNVNHRILFVAAWRSFDKASRIRLIKFYIKYFGILVGVVAFYAMLAAVTLLSE